jgi:hypothetical protein
LETRYDADILIPLFTFASICVKSQTGIAQILVKDTAGTSFLNRAIDLFSDRDMFSKHPNVVLAAMIFFESLRRNPIPFSDALKTIRSSDKVSQALVHVMSSSTANETDLETQALKYAIQARAFRFFAMESLVASQSLTSRVLTGLNGASTWVLDSIKIFAVVPETSDLIDTTANIQHDVPVDVQVFRNLAWSDASEKVLAYGSAYAFDTHFLRANHYTDLSREFETLSLRWSVCDAQGTFLTRIVYFSRGVSGVM